MINVYGQPNVDFSFDAVIGCAPLLVNFNDLSTSNNGNIIEWVWGLGGSTGIWSTSESTDPIFTTFQDEGFHTVTLKVKDDKGCEQSLTKQNIIQVEEKPTIFVASKEAIGCKFPMTIDFENYGLEDNVIYEWDFGNGQTFEGFNPDPIEYVNQGNYDVIVKSRFVGSDCTDELILDDYISVGGSIHFDFFPKVGCRGLQVQFEDLSPIDASSWEWDFGDGTTSSERDPAHVYQEVGEYNIRLFRKTDECEGGKTSEYKVIVSGNPVIDGVIENPSGCLLPAQVNLKATGDNDLNYSWFVGDPGNYLAEVNGKNAAVEFSEYGMHRVALIVSNSVGCVSTLVFDTLKIEPLKLEIIGDLEGCVPFTASVGLSSNAESPLTNVMWELKGLDSFINNSSNFDFQMDSEGSYNVKVTAENSLGCRDTLDEIGIIRGGPAPGVDFVLSDTTVCPTEIVQFMSNSSGNIDFWEWTIGDTLKFETENFNTQVDLPGSYDVKLTVGSNGCYVSKTIEDYLIVKPPGTSFDVVYNCDNPNSVLAINASVNTDSIVWKYGIGTDTIEIVNQDSIWINYSDDGPHLLALTGFHYDSGCSNIFSDRVELRKPKAKFTVDKLSGCSPLEVNFKDASEDAVEWQYFTSAGTFLNPSLPDSKLRIKFGGKFENIGLIVRDNHGCADTTYSDPIQVNGLISKFGAPEPVCVNDTLSISNFSKSTFGTITNYSWILGNSLAFSNEENANFTVSEIGKFDLKLIVQDDFGCIDSSFLGLGAFFRAPNFELISDSLACTTGELSFRNGLHAAGYKYAWNFGDGTTSDLVNPTHQYSAEGDYLVRVIIEDNQKCVNEMDLAEVIRVYDPKAKFSVDSTFAACPPLISNFSNESENAIKYVWDFGDNTGFGSTWNPSHLYSYGGIFDVQLIAIRSEQCIDTFRMDDLIQLNGPNGEIKFEVDSSCVPLNVHFEANLDEEYTMTWDFGDGNLVNVNDPTQSAFIDHSYLNAGNYIPKIILTNNENCTIVRSGENIQSHDLIASFSILDGVFCDTIPDLVQFKSETTSTSPIVDYKWTVNDEGAVLSQSDILNYNPDEYGFYSFKLVAESEFCKDSIKIDSVLRIGYAPIIEKLRDTFACIDVPISLMYQPLNAEDRFSWFNMDNEEVNGEQLSAESDQLFYIEVENEYFCKSKDTFQLRVINDQTRFAGPDKTICEGNETNVYIEFGQSLQWPENLDCLDCRNQLLAPITLTSYKIRAMDTFGCVVIDTLVIDVLNDEDISAGDDQKVCFTDTPVLIGYAPGELLWSPVELLSNPESPITPANISESMLFTLTSTKDECTLIDSVWIEIIDKAELETIGDTVCYGDFAQLYAGGSVDNVYWVADPTLSALDISNPVSSTLASRLYSVIGALGGCETDTAEVLVHVYPEIVASIPERVQYFKSVSEVNLSFSQLSLGDYQFLWRPEDLISCPTCEEVKVSVDGSPLDVSVTITDRDSGCELEKFVEVRQFENCAKSKEFIGVPNIFSPNDDGFNDVLSIEAPAFSEIRSVNIYDRWGQRVFYSNGLNESWDGKLNGINVAIGVYSYSVIATCPEDGSSIVKAGDVTVIR